MNMNTYYEQEEAKIRFQMIFNEDPAKYTFANTKHLELVNRYGLLTVDVQKAFDLTNLHIKLQSDSARCGVYIDDDTFVDLMRSNFYS